MKPPKELAGLDPARLLARAERQSTPAPAWEPPPAADIEAMLPGYADFVLIGRGGMGAVYRARQKSLDRAVAVKIFPPGVGGADPQFAARFQREAQAMAKLSHPGIVSVFDAGETADGVLFYVMELVDGTDLARVLAGEGKLDPARAIAIASAVCEALSFAHAAGIVHRDIKPSNIMLDQHGRVKVTDFGLAKMDAATPRTALTRSGAVLGTPDFIAPETLADEHHADHRADIYAVGVTLYLMLTGEVPRGVFRPPSRAVAGVDPKLDGIIARALQRDPIARHPSAAELRREIEAVRAGIRGVPRGAWVALAAACLVAGGFAAVKMFSTGEAASPSEPAQHGVSPTPDATSEWMALFTRESDFTQHTGRGVPVDGWWRLQGSGAVATLQVRDAAVRATMRYQRDGASLTVRYGGGPHAPYTAFISGEGTVAALIINRTPDGKSRERHQFPLPRPLKEGEEYTLEFGANGDVFFVGFNGQRLGTVRDTAPVPQGLRLGVMSPKPGVAAYVKDIAWRRTPAAE